MQLPVLAACTPSAYDVPECQTLVDSGCLAHKCLRKLLTVTKICLVFVCGQG